MKTKEERKAISDDELKEVIGGIEVIVKGGSALPFDSSDTPTIPPVGAHLEVSITGGGGNDTIFVAGEVSTISAYMPETLPKKE